MLVTVQITLFLSVVLNATCSLYKNCLIVHVTDSQGGHGGILQKLQYCKKKKNYERCIATRKDNKTVSLQHLHVLPVP